MATYLADDAETPLISNQAQSPNIQHPRMGLGCLEQKLMMMQKRRSSLAGRNFCRIFDDGARMYLLKNYSLSAHSLLHK